MLSQDFFNDEFLEERVDTFYGYGIGYESSWRRITEKITDVEFSSTSEGFLICQNSQTVFVIAKHPVTRGLTNEYFHNIGRSIAAKIAEKSLFA
ncbi:MAG: hypothetical protein V7K86_06865 [Nostoc sp.]|uniref:hypothetical protein n=1 Tax=Nostoc sp. TaxID=1180 RepID=UPI002FFA80A5